MLTGTVKAVRDVVIYFDLPGGHEGVLAAGDLATPADPLTTFKKGQSVSVKIVGPLKVGGYRLTTRGVP